MSWCRWSTILESGDTSDLYIYDSVYGGVSINIAARRQVNIREAPQPIFPTHSSDEAEMKLFIETYQQRMDWLEEHSEFENINLPYDGDTLILDEPEDIYNFLIELRELGYRFPDSVFECLEEYKLEKDHL